MSWRSTLVPTVVALAAAALAIWLLDPIARAWLAVGSHPQVLEQLERSREDQRRLAELDPESEATYRQRFEEIHTMAQRLRVLQHSREALLARYETILLAVVGFVAALAAGAHLLRQSHQNRRLERLRGALAQLSAGSTEVDLGERRRDLLGRIAAMVEQASRVMARDRRRLAALENLSAWQEAARRHAHEMRTPLTGAGLELERLEGLLAGERLDHGDDVHQAVAGARKELERLRRFTQEFTSFGRLPRPQLVAQDLAELVEEFTATFENAWPGLRLVPPEGRGVRVAADRDLLRQVLVNLCDNSALALAGRGREGTQTFTLSATGSLVALDVTDDGPGVSEGVRGRLFEPYSTTRGVGEGMGLGLAVSKKILLDHGGDLELVSSSAAGTTFRLTLPEEPRGKELRET